MKKNFKEIMVVCLTAGLFCMSAQSESLDVASTAEDNKEITLGTCKEPMEETRESCKMKSKACTKDKEDETPRKSAARRVVEGS